MWVCRCDCGSITAVYDGNLRSGHAKSCGCLKDEMAHIKRGKLHPCWDLSIDDKDRRDRRDRRDSYEYKEWRKAVYARDNYACCKCGSIGRRLNAHHLNSYSDNISGRIDLSNARTLCVPCHNKFHSLYGYGNNITAQYVEWSDSNAPRSY